MNNVIEITNLYLSYSDIKVLENINLQIPENSFVSIVGPNGAGKTTLMKILLGLVNYNSGDVKVFGKTPAQVDPSLIGYVPQIKTMDRSFPALAIELVSSGITRRWPWHIKSDDKKKSLDALALVKAEKLANRTLSELSGGELQRVCLARSIVRQPKLVVLDEPATGIDAIGEADLYNHLETYKEKSGATILMITHDWHVANHHSDFVLLLNRKQVSFGSPAEALSENNLRIAFGHIGHIHKSKIIH
jgi:zinc transport system ATP-binding protein